MGLLDIFRSSRTRTRPVGQKLEKGRVTESHPTRGRNLAVKSGIFVLLVLVTLGAFPRGDYYQYAIQVGDEWRSETLTAPLDFPIYKSEEELRADRRSVRHRTPPFFLQVPNPLGRIEANRDSLAQQLERTFSAYESFLRNKSRGRLGAAAEDSARYLALRRNTHLQATPEQWQMLANSYAERIPDLTLSSRAPMTGQRLDRELLLLAWQASVNLTRRGVLDSPKDSIHTDVITVREDVRQRSVDKDPLLDMDEASEIVHAQARQRYRENPAVARLAVAFFRAIFEPTYEYLRGETLHAWQRIENRVPPTLGKVNRGDVIIRKGQRVTEETRVILSSLARAQTERSGTNIPWRLALGQALLTLTVYVLFFLYLFLLRKPIFEDNRQVLLIALLFAGITGLFATALRVDNAPMFAVPVAIASVLLTVVFDSRVGLFGTITLALIGGNLLGYDFEFAYATIFAGALGVFSVRDIKNRGQFFLSAGLVFVGYVSVLFSSWLVLGITLDRFLSDLLLVGINSFLLIMAYPLLWVFERAFDVTTDLTLLELSDTNRPLVKELSLRAPGTFNHSLQVSNLAEAAADSIGANALLARVGALYHDIGKMLKPEYFVENQRPGDNPHDQLKPRMSALIIASHVKEGLELGRQYNLPERVLNFIPMHHGTTRIEYFYQKALEQRGPDDPPLLESEFRYPGPRPDSKETGILMLADSVEAASRSLSDPTHKRLETLVEMIFKARVEDGQLDETDLTFQDLNRIKETFLAMLLGIYHVRVRYPGQAAMDDAPEGKREAPQPQMSAEALQDMKSTGVIGIPEQSIKAGRKLDAATSAPGRAIPAPPASIGEKSSTPNTARIAAPEQPPDSDVSDEPAGPVEADDASATPAEKGSADAEIPATEEVPGQGATGRTNATPSDSDAEEEELSLKDFDATRRASAARAAEEREEN